MQEPQAAETDLTLAARGARATALREQGRLDEAEAAYRRLHDEAPGWFFPLLGLGLCARQRGDSAGALPWLAAAAPHDRGARHEYATALRELGRTAEAEAQYRAQLAAFANWPPALLGLGLCARARGDEAAAEPLLAAALAAMPQARDARIEYATLLREGGRAAEAAAQYRHMLAADPDWPPALLGLGLCARALGDPAEAERLLAAAVAAAPQDRNARHEYATVLREQRKTAAAAAEYQEILRATPAWAPALLGLGLCARLEGNRGAALAHLRAAVEAAPQDPVAALELLTEYCDAGDLEAARGLAGQMLAQDPHSAEGWLGTGRIARQAGDRAAALAAFGAGSAHHPARRHFLVEMAIEAQALGRFDEAEAWLQQAAADPALRPLAFTLRGEQARMGQRFETAVELFRRAIEDGDAPPEAYDSLSQTLADLGRLDEALDLLAGASANAARPELAARRAALLRRAGRREEALALVRAAAAASPASFPLWYERFENERFAVPPGDAALSTLEPLLAAAPAARPHERALLGLAHGLLAEQRWDLSAAAAAFRAAIALDGGIGALHEALARVSLLRCDPATARQHLRHAMRLAAPMRRLQGLSLHLAHTHLGQILDEFVMDTEVLGAVAASQALPPAARIDALLPLVHGAAGNTLPAVALLIALRQAGWLAAAALGPSARIPARIAQFWDSPAVPEDVAGLMRSWPEQNPQHAYTRFDRAEAEAFLAAHCRPAVAQAFRRAGAAAMKADLFRLAWLFSQGGVYADADDRCLRPLSALLPAEADLVAYQEEYGTLGNNFLAAAPFHPVIGLALDLAVAAINRGDDDLLWLATGPGLVTRAMAQTLASSCVLPRDWLGRTAILQRHELARGVAAHCQAAYQSTRHYWPRAAFGQNAPPD